MNVLPEGIRDVSAQLGENSVGREWRKEVKEEGVGGEGREGGIERDGCIIMSAQHSFTHSAILLVVVSIEITLSYS